MDHLQTNFFNDVFPVAQNQRTISRPSEKSFRLKSADHCRPSWHFLLMEVKHNQWIIGLLFKTGCSSSLKPADHQRTNRKFIQTETSGPLADHPHITYLRKFNKIGGPLADQLFKKGFSSCLKPADHQRTIREITQNETNGPLADHPHISCLWK